MKHTYIIFWYITVSRKWHILCTVHFQTRLLKRSSVASAHLSRDLKNCITLIYIFDTATQFYRATQTSRWIARDISDRRPLLNHVFRSLWIVHKSNKFCVSLTNKLKKIVDICSWVSGNKSALAQANKQYITAWTNDYQVIWHISAMYVWISLRKTTLAI